MPKLTDRKKTECLNAAFGLLARGLPMAEAMVLLSRQFTLSERQAYHYVEAAQLIDKPVAVAEPPVAATYKLPPDVICVLKARAAAEDMTMSNLVSQALRAFLGESSHHG
jgi:hypothetical protein